MTCPHCGRVAADYGVQLGEACRRLGISQRYGEKLIQEGKFPVPELKRLPGKSRHRFSARTIEEYLRDSSVADVHAQPEAGQLVMSGLAEQPRQTDAVLAEPSLCPEEGLDCAPDAPTPHAVPDAFTALLERIVHGHQGVHTSLAAFIAEG